MDDKSEKFVLSDPHLGHEKCWSVFKQSDGCTPLRPFTSTEEMNQTILDNWRRVVRPQDHIYVLGDLVIKKQFLELFRDLPGHKRLIRGNHDVYDTRLYIEVGFREILGCRVFRKDAEGLPDCILTHIPIHPACMGRWGTNVHGHLHGNIVMRGTGEFEAVQKADVVGNPVDVMVEIMEPDARYVNVSVEQINYTPARLRDIVRPLPEHERATEGGAG